MLVRNRHLIGVAVIAALCLIACPEAVAEKRTLGPAARARLEMLRFEPNYHQAGGGANFSADAANYKLLLTSADAVFTFKTAGIRVKLLEANPEPSVGGLEPFPGTVNYFIGNDPRKWRTDVPSFAKVKYQEVYPGVDLVYYGTQHQIEYDFVVAPGADPSKIALSILGASRIRVDRRGNLILKIRDGEVRFHRPVVYQQDPERTPVGGRYVLHNHRVGFEIGRYNRRKPLIIDPVVTYSTYLGGTLDLSGQPAGTDGYGISVDSGGNMYLVGSTTAVKGLPLLNAYQSTAPDPNFATTCPANFDGNAFVAKLSPAGIPIYITYLGGSQCNQGMAIAADASGNAFVTGWTEASDFPIVGCTFQCSKPNAGTAQAAFLSEFNSAGAVTHSTYIASGRPGSLALDSGGNVYVAGGTDASFSAKTTPGAYRTTCASGDTYVAKLSPAGAALFATCLGSNTAATGIALDSGGNLYVAGSLRAPSDFAIVNGFQAAVAGGVDGYLAKLSLSGSTLLYTTLFGGSLEDDVTGVAADNGGNAYIAGNTGSFNLPVTSPLFKSSCLPHSLGTCTAFVARFNTLAAGAASLSFATYLGGSSGDDAAQGIAVDAAGNGYAAGFTASSDFPTVNPMYACQGCASANESMFVTQFNSAGTILFSTFLGGSSADNDEATSIALDAAGAIYLTGTAGSNNLPPALPIPGCLNPVQSTPVSNFVAFALRLSGGAGSGVATDTTLVSSVNPSISGQSVTFTATVSAPALCGATPTGTVTFRDGASVIGAGPLTNGTAVIATSTLSVGSHSITAVYGGDPSFTGSTAAPVNQQVVALAPPAVTTQPLSQTVCAGQSVNFTAAASGTPSPSVQWQISVANGPFANIPGATSTTLNFTATASQNGNQYRAVFTNAGGTATTNLAALTVNLGPVITTNPGSQTVNNGQTATFTAAATGQPAPSVQWQVSVSNGPFTNVPQATSPVLTFTADNSLNGNQYRAEFTNSCAVATSAVATLTVGVSILVNESIKVADTSAINVPATPSITLQPVTQAVCAGQFVTFTVAASGRPAPAVQWQVSVNNGPFTNILLANAPTLSFTAAATQDGNQYRAVFTNAAGSATTVAATLNVNTAPVVTVNPASQTVNSGVSVTFTAAGAGKPAPTVQWQVSVNNGSFTNIPQANGLTLTFTADNSQYGNRYRAVFTDSCGAVATTVATLTVNAELAVNESIKVLDSPGLNNTPSGSNVVVQPVDKTTGTSPVMLTFGSVTRSGLTTLTTSTNGPPPPAGFQLGSPSVYYDLSTTATFNGSILVCIDYTGIVFPTPPGPRLFHYENGSWVDRTVSVDTVNLIVCGSVTSLSPFGLFRAADITPPVTHATVSPVPNAVGWNNTNVMVTLNSADEPGGSGVKQITYSATGALTIPTTVIDGASTVFAISAEGVTTVTFFAADNVGNVEASKTLTIKLDKTPPTISCTATPNVLWPPDHKLAPVSVDIEITDRLSGPAGFTLTSVMSNQPDHDPGDIQGWMIDQPSTTGQLRAERNGEDGDRIYTLTYRGLDQAGNSAKCVTTVTVPHDQGHP